MIATVAGGHGTSRHTLRVRLIIIVTGLHGWWPGHALGLGNLLVAVVRWLHGSLEETLLHTTVALLT